MKGDDKGRGASYGFGNMELTASFCRNIFSGVLESNSGWSTLKSEGEIGNGRSLCMALIHSIWRGNVLS